MKSLEESMVHGFVIETINPETGEVQWWKLSNDKKFTHLDLLAALEMGGWNYGEFLFLKEEGDLTKIYTDSFDWEFATISTKLAKSFRKDKFAKFIHYRK